MQYDTTIKTKNITAHIKDIIFNLLEFLLTFFSIFALSNPTKLVSSITFVGCSNIFVFITSKIVSVWVESKYESTL